MTQQYNNDFEREFGWDDTIEKDSGGFTILTPGEYYFKVESFDRARHTPSANNTNPNKLPACNKAVIKLKIITNDGEEATLTHNLFLHSRTEGLLSAFFGAIGQKRHGEPLQMNWQMVPGAIGVCSVKHREHNGSTYNEVNNMIYVDDVEPTKVLNQNPNQQQQQAYQAPTYQQPPVQNYQSPTQQAPVQQQPAQPTYQAGQF